MRQLEQIFSLHPLASHIRPTAVLRARVPIVQATLPLTPNPSPDP